MIAGFLSIDVGTSIVLAGSLSVITFIHFLIEGNAYGISCVVEKI